MANLSPQQLAKNWLKSNCLILDTETTGLGNDAEIVEITLLDTTGEILLNTLVKPRGPIPPEATAIHGITNEMVSNAPSWIKVCSKFYHLISGRKVVIYNSDYDTRLLEQTNAANWIVGPCCVEQPVFECAMLAYAKFYGQKSERGGYKWQKLTAAAEQQGVIIEGTPHRALCDCLTTLGVIKAMANGGRRHMPQVTSAERAVDVLNGLLKVDPDAIATLVNHRVECSETFARETPAIAGIKDWRFVVGLLGIINALIAPEVIAAIYDGEDLTGFAVTDITDVGGAA
ncbi:3'-5' exonuclease [Serratia liquefaciens]|uniref:3'-5' exonuclease n=1 Tax=Serratia liquefaciens TaxID=614 RepID=UPI0018E429B0|nr:3'-5' exonuclease [Serratia liquefaciens]